MAATVQIFHPAEDGKGKWHRANAVSGTALCGAPVVLDAQGGSIHGEADQPNHPICCKNCSRI